MARNRIVWSQRAEAGRKEVRTWISQDAPRRAVAFEKRIIKEVNRLRRWPYLGSVLDELGLVDVRQFFVKDIRIVYRVDLPLIKILVVQHGSKLVRPRDLEF